MVKLPKRETLKKLKKYTKVNLCKKQYLRINFRFKRRQLKYKGLLECIL